MLAILLSLSIALGPARNPEPGPGSGPESQAAFEAGWQVVSRYLADQHWERARERLVPLLEQHARAPYVLLRRPEIVDALERIGFYHQRRRPEVEDLVQGDLVRWRPHSGQVEIRYRPKQMGDFQVPDGQRGGFRSLLPPHTAEQFLLHPAQFAGPCKIVIQGESYAPTLSAPTVYAGVDVDSRLAVTLGYRARSIGGKRMQAQPGISWVDRGHDEPLVGASTAPIESGESYTVEVALGHDSISVSIDGDEFLRAKRPRGKYGQLGLSGFSDLTSITIEGEIEPAWLEGLLDAEVQRQWIEFRRQGDVQQDLPDWLRMPAPTWDLGPQDPESAGAIQPAAREALVRVEELLARGEVDGAIEVATSLEGAEDALPGHVAWLLIESTLGRWEGALERAQAVLDLAPQLRFARRFRAAIELMLRDLEPAREHLLAELALDPDDDWAPARLAKLELLSGNLDEVERALHEAVRDGHYTPELDDVNRTLVKARNGPPWRRVHEYRYGRYVVRSDIDRQTCLDASRTLGSALALFEKWIRPLPAERREPFSVYIFSGQWSYLSYGEDVLEFAPENTAGVYSPWLRQLLIWNLPARDEMLATIRHEAFHQYLDSLLGVSPMWLNEGLAELWEAADPTHFDGRRLPVAAEHASLLRNPGVLMPLEEFLYLDRSQFMGSAAVNYAQAWALVHMLFQDSRSGRHVLLELIDHLREGLAPEEATRRAFARQDLEKLDRALAEHVRGL